MDPHSPWRPRGPACRGSLATSPRSSRITDRGPPIVARVQVALLSVDLGDDVMAGWAPPLHGYGEGMNEIARGCSLLRSVVA